MRVIGGEFRSRKLKPVPGDAVRPTPDRLRESLFNILAPRIEGAVFVDAYAGTGAVGIEAISRGAAKAIFIEKHRAAVEVLEDNIRSLSLATRCKVIRGPANLYLKANPGDIVFLDPPYPLEDEYDTALTLLGEQPPPLVIAQHSSKLSLPTEYGALRRTRVVKQGDNSLSFYSPSA